MTAAPRSAVEPGGEASRVTAGELARELQPAQLSERRERWLRLSARGLIDKRPTATGVRLRFRDRQGAAAELNDLVALERECCSFANWLLSRSDEELVLEVSGEGDAVRAVRALFAEPVQSTL